MIDPCILTILLLAFETDSSSRVPHLIWMGTSTTMELSCSHAPPVILVGPRLNNLAVSLGSRSQVSNLTEMRSLSSIELHYYVLTVTLIDPCLSIIFLPALETDLCNSTSRLTSMSLVVLHYFSVPSVILIGVSLDNLAIDLQTRFQMWDVPSDLDEMFRIYLQLI